MGCLTAVEDVVPVVVPLDRREAPVVLRRVGRRRPGGFSEESSGMSRQLRGDSGGRPRRPRPPWRRRTARGPPPAPTRPPRTGRHGDRSRQRHRRGAPSPPPVPGLHARHRAVGVDDSSDHRVGHVAEQLDVYPADRGRWRRGPSSWWRPEARRSHAVHRRRACGASTRSAFSASSRHKRADREHAAAAHRLRELRERRPVITTSAVFDSPGSSSAHSR
jgi:hypothetical protein